MNWLLIGVLFALACCGALASDDIPPPRRVDVGALVNQLGSEDYAEREAASRRLAKLHVDEPPAELLAALQSPNPEIRNRAQKALRQLREHIELMRLPRSERFAKRGQLDLYVASTAVSKWKVDDPRTWEPALDVGRVAIKQAEMTEDRIPQGCPAMSRDFATYKKVQDPRFTRVEEAYTTQSRMHAGGTQAPGVTATWGFLGHIVVSRGPVSTAASQHSLVLATGDVSSGDDIQCSVVICDGDVRVKRNVRNSLILAHGKITIEGTAYTSNLYAGQTVTIAKPREVTASPMAERRQHVVVKEHETNPLGFITFFELSTAGVEVKVAEKVVRVAKVTEEKPFADAGIKAGDVIVSVNGKNPDSAESLRRLLRDALAIGDATVAIRRGEKTETMKLSLPE